MGKDSSNKLMHCVASSSLQEFSFAACLMDHPETGVYHIANITVT